MYSYIIMLLNQYWERLFNENKLYIYYDFFFIILLVKKNNRVSKKTLRQVRKHIKHVKIRKQSIKNPYYKHNTHKKYDKGKLYIFIFYSIMYSIIKQKKKWKFIIIHQTKFKSTSLPASRRLPSHPRETSSCVWILYG